MSRKTHNFFAGYFALGLIVGISLTIFTGLIFTPCDAALSSLWFCDESESIVLGTLNVIQTTVIGLAWPSVLLLLGIVYHRQISDALPRITKAGPGGVEFAQVIAKQHIAPASLDELVAIPGVERSASAAKLEVELHQNLLKFDQDIRLNLLVRELAQTRLNFAYLDIYRIIFGSQIRFMKEIRANGRELPLERLFDYFRSLQSENEFHKGMQIEDYTAFLATRGLIFIDSESVFLTDYGNDFLAFVFDNALPENVPF